MTNKQRCVNCDKELKWGGFGRGQEVCWECTRAKAVDILETLTGEEREFFVWAMQVVAERYGKLSMF